MRFAKKTAYIVAMTLLVATGCASNQKGTSNEKVNYKIGKEKKNVQEKYRYLREWNGTWESFTGYCKDEKLDTEWKKISEKAGIKEKRLKDTFSQICFITDDIKYFKINKNNIIALDSNEKKVFDNEYILIDSYGKNSKKTVIEGEKSYLLQSKKQAGRYSYICIMPICSLEENGGNKMLKHFHFNYGRTIKEATNRSRIPTMVKSTQDDMRKKETLVTFFGA